MTYKTLKTNFERELILTLVLDMRKKKISHIRAKNISKAFLNVLNTTSIKEELLNQISKLCPIYPEIVNAYIKVSRNFEEENTREKLSAMSFYLMKGQIEEALKSAKGEGN